MSAIEIANADVLPTDIEVPTQSFGTIDRLPSAGRPVTVTAALSRKQKAEIIVRLLLAEGAELSLQALPEALQTEMIRQMSGMRYVDRATLKAVVDEFVAEIEDIGSTMKSTSALTPDSGIAL